MSKLVQVVYTDCEEEEFYPEDIEWATDSILMTFRDKGYMWIPLSIIKRVSVIDNKLKVVKKD